MLNYYTEREKEELKNEFLRMDKRGKLSMMNELLEASWKDTIKKSKRINRIKSNIPNPIQLNSKAHEIQSENEFWDLPLEEYKVYF